MKTLFTFYHFLGSIYFAITLIALTALFVATGTFLEASTGSHLFSANFTYHHPVFLTLLWGFFINILVSALRRWPFQKKHIPFLMTHLGLLMILAGVIIKTKYGVQGNMGLTEGNASNRIFLPHTQALQLEKRDATGQRVHVEYPFLSLVKQKVKLDGMEISLVDYAQHSNPIRQTWIKGPHLFLFGQRPIPVSNFNQDEIPITNKKMQFYEDSDLWDVQALYAQDVGKAAKQLYLQGLQVQISETKTGKVLSKMPITDTLFNLSWQFSLAKGLESPMLTFERNGEELAIALMGPDSLINKNLTAPYKGKSSFTIDLVRDPLFLVIHDEHDNDHLFFFNAFGEVHYTPFKNDQLESLIVYDEGFGGYAVQTPFPFEDFSCCRQNKEEAELLRLAVQLRHSLKKSPHLSPPLQLLTNSLGNEKPDLAEVLLQFLQAWDASSQLLVNDESIQPFIKKLDWKQVSLQEQYACGWLCLLLEEMEQHMQQGKSFDKILEEKRWPFAKHFKKIPTDDVDQMITLFSQQLFAAGAQLPRPQTMPEENPAKALSAYLKVFGITLNNIRQPVDSSQIVRIYHAAQLFNANVKNLLSPKTQSNQALAQLIAAMSPDQKVFQDIKEIYTLFQKQIGILVTSSPSPQDISQAFIDYAPLSQTNLPESERKDLSTRLNRQKAFLETPLTLSPKKVAPLQKWEDNQPLVTLEVRKGKKKEYIKLSYDRYGQGLAWPILNGEYLVRFQPQFIEIPYKIRLHDARQINYPGTQQPYSYESDIIVTDTKVQKSFDKTISMNNVYETGDGYRFYLASLSPALEVSPQQVQIVVNYDPVKYILTYPGALIMSLGIILLFWLRPYKGN